MTDKITRRDFNARSAMAILSGVAITITGCNDSASPSAPDSPPPPPTAGSGDVSGVIAANHGHIAIVTGAQLTSASSIAIDITGNADHGHRVELDPSELSAIASGQRVSKISTLDLAHNHTVTFN